MCKHGACFHMWGMIRTSGNNNLNNMIPVKLVHARLRSFVLALLFSPLPLMANADLARVQVIAQGGATQLALRLVDKHQPPRSKEVEWTVWEKQRLAIYQMEEQWNTLALRVEDYPDNLAVEFRHPAMLTAARAYLNDNNMIAARSMLRRLIWQEQATPETTAHARRLVIRSYLQENNIDDAQTALLRYKQDYKPRSAAWQLLHAQVLLRADKPKDAYDVLLGNQSHEGRLLRTLAGLRGSLLTPAKALVEAKRLTVLASNKPELAQQMWSLVAEAAIASKNKVDRVVALEWVLSLPAPSAAEESMFGFTADDLWRAYFALAQQIGNTNRLLVGDDKAWIKLADEQKRDEAYLARALYAFVAHNGHDKAARTTAHNKLVELLLLDGREQALRKVYLESQYYPTVQKLPQSVRHSLAEYALQTYDIKLASELIKGLDKPEQETDSMWWMLRQARIMVYAGEVETALDKLSALLVKRDKLEDGLVTQYMQVVFDLQSIERHQEALGLLEQLFLHTDNERSKREILFWLADSKKALGLHQEAAELYLRSAVYNTPLGGDMWGQSARFHAAETLAEAGLIDDARQVYQRLLKHATSAKQRALILRKTQQLWLREHSTTTR